MMFRRLLVVQLLLLWQGGFLFYSAVVVPIGTDMHGSFVQGTMTRQVTRWINYFGVAALLVFAWDVFVERRLRRHVRWICWVVMSLGMIGLFVLHPWMESLVDFHTREFVNYERFRFLHRVYLWLSTFQWLAALIFTWATLSVWASHGSNVA